MGCTIFKQAVPMIYNWAPYEGFFVGATPVLPQCNIFIFQGVSSLKGTSL
jgi:hypothetical protein